MKKYTEIENHYRDKYIQRFLNQHPELEDEVYIIQEKLDGSNLQINYYLNETGIINYTLYSRNQKTDENFQGANEAIENAIEELLPIAEYYLDFGHSSVGLFGEIFGSGIQKRVDYGNEKYYRVFDIVLDDKEYLPQEILYLVFEEYSKEDDFLIPNLGVVRGLKEALDFNIEFNSKILNKKDNLAEGIVIKPFYKVYTDGHGQPFYLKKKNEKFVEVIKKKKNKEPETEEMVVLREAFSNYINENRVLSCFSKEGEISDPSDIGKYIKMIMDDAKEDFLKDHKKKLMTLEAKDQKKVFALGGREIVKLLNKYL